MAIYFDDVKVEIEPNMLYAYYIPDKRETHDYKYIDSVNKKHEDL